MEFIIRKQSYTLEQIRNLRFGEWAVSNITNMPKSLFKYYRNTVDEESGRNFSLEALETNKVYLQSPNKFDDIYDCSIVFDEYEYAFARLRYYAEHCGYNIKETDFENYLNAFCKNTYDEVIKLYSETRPLEDSIKRVFRVYDDGTIKDNSHMKFVLDLCQGLNNHVDQEYVWQMAFTDALNSEISFIKKKLSADFTVSCFSTSPYMPRMWAAPYANVHQGFCIEYKIPEYSKEYVNLFHNLFPVIYSDVRTSVLAECLKYMEDKSDEQLVENIYKYGILTKSIDWKDQDEWRLVSPWNMLAKDNNCEFFPIQKVYLGNRMSQADRIKIIEICKRKGIEYAGIVHMQDRYELTSCANLCENCHMMKQ